MDIKEEFIKEGVCSVSLFGDLDANSSLDMDDVLSKAITSNNKIIVNCNELNYISSAGLGVFMSHLDEVKEGNKKLVFYGMKENVKDVFNILGLDKLISSVESKEEAIEF